MGYLIIRILIHVYLISDVLGFILTGLHYCPPNYFCSLHCTNGFELFHGCPICRCKSAGMAKHSQSQIPQQPTNQLMTFPTQTGKGPVINIQGSSYHNPCVPSQAFCPLKCDKFSTGSNGCQYCLCDQSIPETSTVATTKIHQTAILANPCLYTEPTCAKFCPFGYLLGPNNCQYCICSPHKQLITKAPPTTSKPATLPNACVPSQKCTLNCSNGFAHGPSGCQYCLCAPKVSTVVSTSGTQIQPNSTMSEQCVIAIAICQVKCKSGFMTDQNDCTFCTCKDEIAKALNLSKSLEPVIKLLKPCVQEFDICNIFCSRGYLRGPDNCQFCACAH